MVIFVVMCIGKNDVAKFVLLAPNVLQSERVTYFVCILTACRLNATLIGRRTVQSATVMRSTDIEVCRDSV